MKALPEKHICRNQHYEEQNIYTGEHQNVFPALFFVLSGISLVRDKRSHGGDQRSEAANIDSDEK